MTAIRPALAAAAAAAGVVAIYLLRLDPVAGLLGDDAWYMVLAQALATGEGYRLISSATGPIMPVVPPGFPMLLAPLFWMAPFPDNVFLLKALSMLAVAGIGLVCWFDLTRHREVPRSPAALLVLATTLTPAVVFLATSSVMAECVFMLGQLVSVVLVERIRRRAAGDTMSPLIAGVSSAAVILIRTAGIAVAVAAVIYLMAGRRWRQVAIYAVTVLIALVPWQLYARANQPTDAERAAHGGTIVYSYQRLLTMSRLSDPSSDRLALRDVASRAVSNVSSILARDVGAVIAPMVYRGASESGEEVLSIGGPRGGSMGTAPATMAVSLLVSAVICIGWMRARRERFAMPALLIGASLAAMAPVGAPTIRYVVPLAPYLLLFLWHGVGRGAAARMAITCVLGLHLLDHGLYLERKFTGTPDWIADARENDELFNWMVANVDERGGVAANNPGLVYLRTGRKTVSSVLPVENWEHWRSAGVRYVVSTVGGAKPPSRLEGRLLFETGRRGLWVVEIDEAR